MVSQHTANVPSARARLGSIPRLSAKFRVSGGYGWPRLPVEQSAPLERPGSNPGAPTKCSNVARPRSPTGRGNRLKIGRVWVRIPAGPPNFLKEGTKMANKTLFASLRDALIPQTNTVNSEGAPAYALTSKQALAQYAATGCFGRTFYAAADEQLTRVLELCDAVDPQFIARVAVYSRTHSFMKDMPALLCAWLSARELRLHEAVFVRVI